MFHQTCNNMYKISCLVVAMLLCRAMSAQTQAPTVLNASGGHIQNNLYSLEWSLGELAVSTLSSTGNLLTQGFLQPQSTIVATEDLFDESRLAVFPNPVSDCLNFQTDIPDIKTVQVHDILGRLVLQSSFQPLLDVQQLERGMYVISLFDKQNQFLHAFKISKN